MAHIWKTRLLITIWTRARKLKTRDIYINSMKSSPREASPTQLFDVQTNSDATKHKLKHSYLARSIVFMFNSTH